VARAFDYKLATNLDEAIALLEEGTLKVKVLSGGTDLIVQLREDLCDADLLVDVKKIPELMELRFDALKGLTLGASVSCRAIYEDPVILSEYPGLVDAALLIGGIQIQNRASFGGNLCNASPAADSIPALIVHRAVCLIRGSQGQREVPVEDFCTGPGQNVLEPGELLVSFRIPPVPRHFGAHYLRFIPRGEMDIAVVGCGASLEFEGDLRTVARARVALGAVAPTPLLVSAAADALEGKFFSEESVERAAKAAQDACRPITDYRGTAAFRRRLAGVLTRRALGMAAQRARDRKMSA
jgi:carbon-monoxide dehydrogenase medium subunit